jgi:hypothetical protein
MPQCVNACQAIFISYEFHHRRTFLLLKGVVNGKADGERLMEGLFNLFMADYIIEIFQSIFFNKTTTCCGCFFHSKSMDTLPKTKYQPITDLIEIIGKIKKIHICK